MTPIKKTPGRNNLLINSHSNTATIYIKTHSNKCEEKTIFNKKNSQLPRRKANAKNKEEIIKHTHILKTEIMTRKKAFLFNSVQTSSIAECVTL